MRKATTLSVIAALTLSACATAPENIAPSYVSPTGYANLSCRQLNAEATALNSRLATATGQQAQKAKNDTTATAVSLILFWPAVFFIKGDDQAPAIAQMRGEAEAIRAAAVSKGC